MGRDEDTAVSPSANLVGLEYRTGTGLLLEECLTAAMGTVLRIKAGAL